VDPETLHTAAERHIRCNPALAQFIVDDAFPPVAIAGPFAKAELDVDFVRQREALVTRGWQRLRSLSKQRPAILDYPLPEFRAAESADGD
jgi:hypothetical protein